jgi:hypothetical protein
MSQNIIEQSDPGIVAKETPVRLSDEKLRNMLSRTYECAQKDMGTKKLRDYYSVFLSVAGTLILSLLTSTFGAIGNISAEVVTKIVWAIFIISAVLGFVLMGMAVSEKTKNDTSNRDKAVNEVFEQYFSKK